MKLNVLANAQDLSGAPPLLEAAVTTSPELIEKLIDECGADPNSARAEESSAVKEYAAELKDRKETHEELVAATDSVRQKVRLSGAKFEESERENKVLMTRIEGIWNQANALLEEQDVEKRRKGGKTDAVRQIQALAKLVKPPSLAISKLSVALCHVLGGGNLGATNPNTYNPEDTMDPPSWWGTFQRSARNLRIGSKMLAVKGTVVKEWKKVKGLCGAARGEENSPSQHSEALKSLLIWCQALTTEQECVSSPLHSPEMIDYIKKRASMERVYKEVRGDEDWCEKRKARVGARSVATVSCEVTVPREQLLCDQGSESRSLSLSRR